MSSIELRLASGDDSLSVRRFGVEERLSEPFGVSVWARSPNEDIDLESVVGRDASFSIQSGLARGLGGRRRFTGICVAMDLLVAEPTGLSTYFLRIVPRLWLLGQRKGHRLFQHQSVPDIAKRLCDEWKVEHRFRLSGDHPKLELRVQYGETDYAFLARLLEEAGISYCCEDDDDKGSTVVFDDAPHARDPRAEPLPFVDEPNESAEREFVTQVRLGQKVQPGRFTLRDHDFRRSPRYQLFGATPRAGALEEELEHYDYAPGSFVVEVEGGAPGGLVGDDRGVARHQDKAGSERAGRRLEAARARRRLVAFRTNALDLAPGRVLTMSGHPRSDLAADKRLLVTDVVLEGTPDDAWTIAVQTAFAALPWRPRGAPAKPSVQGLQSAVIVGPPGEEIHTDELGRVRVQFHWDREGRFDDASSCWMRVSQGWAGGGYGMIAVPRVGQEVLVAFLEGDPDHPVVVGRLYNASALSPYALPQHKTRSGWRSDSSPGSGGFNEIMFEDLKGQELVYLQAERDLEKLVKANETEATGGDRRVSVGGSRTTSVAVVDEHTVGGKHVVTMVPKSGGSPTSVEMVDRRICLTTGEASIVLEGPDVTIMAKGVIKLKSTGGDVELQGAPWVKINCEAEGELASQTYAMHHVTGVLRDQDGEPLAGRSLVVKDSEGHVQTVTSDASGQYLALVPPGKVEVSLPGGRPYSSTSSKLDDMTLEPEVLDDLGPAV